MPTIWEHGPYRFFFYSADGSEPSHVHEMEVNRLMSMLSVKETRQSSGLTPFDCKTVAGTAATKSIVSND